MARPAAFALAAALLAAVTPAFATKVNLVGLFPGKAVIIIDNGPLRTVSVGQKQPEGLTLISTEGGHAVFDIDGKRTTLEIGEHFSPPNKDNDSQTAVLAADGQGHFFTVGQVNGRSVRFLIDTGASAVALSSSVAQSAGIDFQRGTPVMVSTANGPAPAYRVLLDSVRIGDITLHQVEALVHKGAGLDISLLGMSFLNRVDMKREGPRMVLTRRY